MIESQMSEANTKQEFPILIYFSFRGRAQAIRNLICYLKINYYEFFVDKPEHNSKTIPQTVLQKLKKVKVQKQQLPALSHKDLLVYNQEAIMIYLCKFYKHEQLLGTTIYMKARFNELIFTYLPQIRSLSKIYEFAVSSLNNSQQQIDKQAHQLLVALFQQAKYLTYYCEYLSRQQKPQFIFGALTVVDFIFMESTEYLLGLFGKPQRINAENPYAFIQNEKESDSRSIIHYMQILRDYRKWMISQTFYIDNSQYLQSFSVTNSWMSKQKAAGFRKMWVGNPKLVV